MIKHLNQFFIFLHVFINKKIMLYFKSIFKKVYICVLFYKSISKAVLFDFITFPTPRPFTYVEFRSKLIYIVRLDIYLWVGVLESISKKIKPDK